jgi:hypothetical protein
MASQWCLNCWSKFRRRMPATFTHDEEPSCENCLRAEGISLDDCERIGEEVAPKEAPEVKMGTPVCRCGCGTTVSKEGKLAYGHGKKGKPVQAVLGKGVRKQPKVEDEKLPVGTLSFTEPQIDRILQTMPFADKVKALQDYLSRD